MLLIRLHTLEALFQEHGKPDMHYCFAQARGMSAPTNQALLMVNEQQVLLLFISKLQNKVVQKLVFDKNELSDSHLTAGMLLDDCWTFNGRNQRWSFRIPRRILTLGTLQKGFLDYLRDSPFILR